MKNIYIIVCLLCAVQFTNAQEQKKSRADRFYEKNDFQGAVKYYEASLEDEISKQSLVRLADSYYNLSDYANAERAMRLVFNERYVDADKSVDNALNFKMYQVLISQGKVEEGIDYLAKYEEGRGTTLDKAQVLAELKSLATAAPSFTVKESNVNSEDNDFGAVRVGDSIFFTSDRLGSNIIDQLFGKRFKWTGNSFLDIYSARVNSKNDTIGEVKALGNTINTSLHDGNFTFSTDGNVMYLSRSNYDDGKKAFNEENTNLITLYKSVRIDGVWGEAEKLSFVQDGFTYQHPALSPDGKRLYFSSDIAGGEGDYDIYYVQIFNDGNFGTPVNAGTVINTSNREQFPFISERGDIYFSSNGHLGLGSLDVFVSPLSVKGYQKPINLGAPVNSLYDDFSISYYNGTEGFVSSNRNGMNDQIYSFVQDNEIIQREFDVKIEIRDSETKELITDGTITVEGYEKKIVYNNQTDGTASFNTKLPIDDYTLIASGGNYREGTKRVEVSSEKGQVFVIYLDKIYTLTELTLIKEKNLPKDLKEKDPSRFQLLTDAQAPQVVEKEGKLFIDVEPIYFDFDLYEISQESTVVLDELADKLIKYPRIKMRIRSHTDSRGPSEYNIPLSERRAKSTFDYLVNKGVSAERIKYEGYGDTQPVIKCPAGKCTEADHQLNRRSEFEITGY